MNIELGLDVNQLVFRLLGSYRETVLIEVSALTFCVNVFHHGQIVHQRRPLSYVFVHLNVSLFV